MALDAALGRLGIKAGVCTSSTRPANPYSGQVIYETDTDTLLTWNGSSWLNLDQSTKGSDYTIIASGTTAERPASPTAGMIRFNETTGEPEWYSPFSGWLNFRSAPSFQVSYLVVGGGGGGGGNGLGQNGTTNTGGGGGAGGPHAAGGSGGGGGAGGYRSAWNNEPSGGGANSESIKTLFPGSYTVTVGAGGAGGSGAGGSVGQDSVFDNITSLGGGGGGSYTAGVATAGGSGGGGDSAPTTARNGAAGTANQGYSGGDGSSAYTNPYSGGGGGGAGGVGASSTSNNAANGGVGVLSTIISSTQASSFSVGEVNGVNVYYAGGGGGGRNNADAGDGGLGGGGDGNVQGSGNSNGGSGVVILRYYSNSVATISAGLTYQTATVGNETILVFTAGTGTVTW